MTFANLTHQGVPNAAKGTAEQTRNLLNDFQVEELVHPTAGFPLTGAPMTEEMKNQLFVFFNTNLLPDRLTQEAVKTSVQSISAAYDGSAYPIPYNKAPQLDEELKLNPDLFEQLKQVDAIAAPQVNHTTQRDDQENYSPSTNR